MLHPRREFSTVQMRKQKIEAFENRIIQNGGHMKYFYGSLAALTILSIIFLPGCKKDETPAAPSYVDAYTVTYTDPAGTSYSGNFFPIAAGYGCYYTGHANITMTENIPGSAPTSDSVVGPAYGSLQVLRPVSITLQSGTYQLYPVIDAADIQGTSNADTSRFFMKDTQAVYVKAIKLPDGSYLEVTNPLFLKSRLVVGDSWETAPQMDLAQLLESEMGASGMQSDLTLNARSKFFVAGMESISLPIGTRNAVRMEQANDFSLTGTMTETEPGYGTITFTINMTGQIAVVYHMIADTGIVHQNQTGPINIAISAQGQSLTMSIVTNECDLRLEYLSGSPIVSKHGATVKQQPQFRTELQQRMWNISQALSKVVTKGLSVQ
jgi:hypothetical protein